MSALPVEILTTKLRLRPWQQLDRAAFGALLNTPATTAFLGGVLSSVQVDALLARRIADFAKGGTCYWAVELADSHTLVGSVGVRIASDYPGTPVHGMYEAGWRLGEDYWGLGLADEAARAAIEWARLELGAETIGSWTTAGNAPSLAVMRRLGFVRRQELDFARPGSGEHCLVHILERPTQEGV